MGFSLEGRSEGAIVVAPPSWDNDESAERKMEQKMKVMEETWLVQLQR